MPRLNRPTPDLSQKAGNPTHGLEQNYERLMQINDPDELKMAAVELAKSYVGKGMKPAGYQKFIRELERASQRGLEGLQFFLTNFMLAGSGMRVMESAQEALSTYLTESTCIRLTPRQREIKMLVESYGFYVAVNS